MWPCHTSILAGSTSLGAGGEQKDMCPEAAALALPVTLSDEGQSEPELKPFQFHLGSRLDTNRACDCAKGHRRGG